MRKGNLSAQTTTIQCSRLFVKANSGFPFNFALFLFLSCPPRSACQTKRVQERRPAVRTDSAKRQKPNAPAAL